MFNYIFDLDGTLIDSSNEILKCLSLALKLSGCNDYISKLNSNIIGPPIDVILTGIGVDKTKINDVKSFFREIYDNSENDESSLYDGVIDVLYKLKSENKKLFIATMKPEKPTKRLLKKFKNIVFDDVYTVDKFGSRMTKEQMIEDIIAKYKLRKNETVMVGDTLGDILAAKKSAITAVGVLWGYSDNKGVLSDNADMVIENIGELCLK